MSGVRHAPGRESLGGMVERLVRRLAAGRSRNRSGGSRPPAEGYRDRASTQTRFFRNEPQLSAVVRAVARTWR